MDSLAKLLEDAADAISDEDRPNTARALQCVRIARGRLDQSPVNRAARLLYQEMDAWATFTGGTVRPEVIVQLLAQEGLLRDEREDEHENG